MAVLDPVILEIENYPEEKEEWLQAENNPEDDKAGVRLLPFSKVLYIERADFKEKASSKYFRLSLEKEVRLKNAYIIKATRFTKDARGIITKIYCTYDPLSLSGSKTPESVRKVKGTIHWVSKSHATESEVREYDRLFVNESPDNHKEDFMTFINPESLKVRQSFIEPYIKKASVGQHFQFQRLGYFILDKDTSLNHIVFNKTVGLRDTWDKKPPKQSKKNHSTTSLKKKPIDIIKQLGKRYTNLPDAKQLKVKAEIKTLAKEVSYDDLQPLLNTAEKKVGTRIAIAITLKVLISNGLSPNEQINKFLSSVKTDNNPLLRQEA
jgi:glutaminyl-tRNA synthetase